MKTLHTEFKAWVGDNIYYVSNSDVVETYVFEIEFEFNINCRNDKEGTTRIEYKLQNGHTMYEHEIGTMYFTDKKELIQHLVAQL